MENIWGELAVGAGSIIIGSVSSVAVVRYGLSELVRRVERNEQRISDLPKDYVPRSEVQSMLKGIEDIAKHTRDILQAFIFGRQGAAGALQSIEAAATYDHVSEARLALVHPDLARRVRAAMDALAVRGTYFRVAQGLRTYAEQDALFAQGRTAPGHKVTNARGGWSNHNFGCAVDCYPFLSGSSGDLNWNPKSEQFIAMVDALTAQGLEWGGRWESIEDPPHFQLAYVPVTPTEADRAAFEAGGLHAVWAQYKTPTTEPKP